MAASTVWKTTIFQHAPLWNQTSSLTQRFQGGGATLLTAKEVTSVEETEEQMRESAVLLKESSVINFESKESLKNAEVTSSTGLTLPTGVSTFLIECLDVDSTADYNTGSNDSVNLCSSPEIFRDEDNSDRSNLFCEDFVKYKNSTLLDSSKAVTIDKIPQISNLSAILEPVQEDFQDQYTRRNKPSKCNYSSSELNVSTTVAGKKVCKITVVRERTPDKTDLRCPPLDYAAEREGRIGVAELPGGVNGSACERPQRAAASARL
ncbi:PREDICTED: uncharacterized protein LOC104565884 [Tinamus guttatus]|uniref:uncharacterized protein LOC104565884 n=1 Tax=Tinamus guttatus TaxID=94827 RepID=UPI00052F248C|nr:PREDICTED: uncharacterized protein LOC104565884 [Tinamus guttatus]